MDSQSRIAISILGQQVLNLSSSITGLITNGFDKHLEHALKIEGKLDDFLEGKIAFQMISVKLSRLLNTATLIDTSLSIDPRLQRSVPANNSAFSSFFVSTALVAASAVSNTASTATIFFISPPQPPPLPPTTYALCRNVHTVTELWREWHVGLGTGSSIALLNDQYGADWRKGWSGKDREFYSKRLAIIKYIHEQAAGGSVEAMVATIELERANRRLTLNALSMRIRKGLE